MHISDFIRKYSEEFQKSLENIIVTDKNGKAVEFADAVRDSVTLLHLIQKSDQKVYLIGNGGSAGITSHTAIDLWKNGGIPAQAFNDASLLTCLANDIGFEDVFAKPLEMFAKKGDLVICISSSGSSQNIIRGCSTAIEKGCAVITLSAFDPENPLRKLGGINFFVPAFSYGFAEIIHQYILHCILDAKMYCLDNKDVFNKNS